MESSICKSNKYLRYPIIDFFVRLWGEMLWVAHKCLSGMNVLNLVEWVLKIIFIPAIFHHLGTTKKSEKKIAKKVKSNDDSRFTIDEISEKRRMIRISCLLILTIDLPLICSSPAHTREKKYSLESGPGFVKLFLKLSKYFVEIDCRLWSYKYETEIEQGCCH